MTFFELSELLAQNKLVDFMKALDEMNAIDAAEYLEYVDPAILPKVFRLFKKIPPQRYSQSLTLPYRKL